MAQRNQTWSPPKLLLDQISQRAVLNGRKRNAEVRYLLEYALDAIGDQDAVIALPKYEPFKSIARITSEQHEVLLDRSQRFQRALGVELVRLVAYAIELRTSRDLAMISEMVRRGSAAAAPR